MHKTCLARRIVARMAQMIVGCRNKSHVMSLVEISPAEPLEVAMKRMDLHKIFELLVTYWPIRRLMCMGNHKDVLCIVSTAQSFVQLFQHGILL